MDRMSAADAMFFYMEAENTPMHVGSVAVLNGAAPTYGELVRLLASKLDRVPRYRQVVREVPLHLGRPVWVDDPHFQILYHVRHAALPSPGGEEQLRNLAGRVFAQRLDMSKPVWECWLVEGLEGAKWALISKAHHCLVDGVAGTDLMQLIFDLEPDAVLGEPVAWAPHQQPSGLSMMAEAVVESVQRPLAALSLPSLAKLPKALGSGRTAAQVLLPNLIPIPGRGSPMPGGLNGSLGPNRRWVWTEASLADVKLVRAALGGTVNDVVLTAVTRGYRDLLQGRGELAPGQVVRSLVPVSTRAPSGQGRMNNEVSGVYVDLPVGQDDPRRRLELVRAQMDRNKRGIAAIDAPGIVGLGNFAAPTLLALGSQAMARLPHNLVQTGVTNVPGPRVPLYLLGRRLVETHPYVPLFFQIRVAVGIFSYLDRFSFGITADFDAFPDVQVMADGIRAGLAELVALAAESAPTAPAVPRKRSATKKGTPRNPRKDS
jgi:diacylglycerol O-acyltransferase